MAELRRLGPQLVDRWVAIDPRGGHGLLSLRTGAVVVDHDEDLAPLCRRIADSQQTSLTIVYLADDRTIRA